MLLTKAFFFFFLRNRSYFGLEAGMFWIDLNMIEKTFGVKDVEHLRVFFFFKGGKSPLNLKLIGENESRTVSLSVLNIKAR